ncbi:MAG: SRPBCC family protein [Nocardioides sp.]
MTRLACSRVFPVDAQTAYRVVMPVPLPTILGTRHWAIPGVREVEQDRPWGQEVGQERVLRFSDGGSATEVLTTLEAPDRFGYRLTDISGPMKSLATSLDGLWTFVPDGRDSTRITWTWDLDPTRPGRVVMPVFTVMWRGMAKRTFDRLGELF